MEMHQHTHNEKWLVVGKPNAGSRKGETDWPAIQDFLLDRGLTFDHLFTQNRAHAIAITASLISNQGYRKIIVVGGDGTLNEVVNGIFSQESVLPGEISLGMVPVGTGNDWCRMYGIPMDYAGAIEVISAGNTFTQDIGFVTYYIGDTPMERYFINVSGMGYDALVAQKTNLMKDKGFGGTFAYFINVFTSLFQYKYADFMIELDDKEVFSGRVLSMNLGICKYNGGGLMQVPHAIPDDGKLDVMIIKATPRINIIRHVSKLYDGSFLRLPFIQTFRGEKCLIRSKPEGAVYLEADGESLGHSPLQFTVLPRAMKFFVPASYQSG